MELAEVARVDSTNSRQMFYRARVFCYSSCLWVTLLINLRADEKGRCREVHCFCWGFHLETINIF